MNREKNDYYQTHACTESFPCTVCGRTVTPETAGSAHRNHCNNCLCSLHLDEEPGDRAANCGGVMEPVGVWVRYKGEWAIIHRCKRCGKLSSNRIAADDNPMKLMSIALKPLCEPPFPLEKLREMTEAMGGDGTLGL
ncbi:MAG: RNHCP domain-containing protein [Candidatus Gallimonas sp.]